MSLFIFIVFSFEIPFCNSKGKFSGKIINFLNHNAIKVNVTAVYTSEQTKKILKVVNKKTKIIISGDTDFASNKFLFSAKNEDLFANSINWLTSDVELISIRPKVKVFRELVLTSDERRFVRWSGWIFLPALSLASAAWTWWRRR